MAQAIYDLAFTPDRRTGEYLFWVDTVTSLTRLFEGVTLAAIVGLFFGVNMGLFPGMRALLMPVTTALSNVPPLALMPILLIAFGVGELAKVVLIFIGTVFLITRDIAIATEAIPREQQTKGLTLGASEFGVVYRVIVPQIIPRLITSVRLALGGAWLFLIAAEAIAAISGVGYRIYLVRRYLAMDVILPYVFWIGVLAVIIDAALWLCLRLLYPWYNRK
jgi:NitT/TauT family transport system permease protein